MTFTLLARDPGSGDLGAAVASHFPAVGGVVPYHRAGVGLVACQSFADAALAEAVLDLLATGAPPALALSGALEGRNPEIRQVLVLTPEGDVAVHSGSACTAHVAEAAADGCIAAGNMLAGSRIAEAMIAHYVASRLLPFADRLLLALTAGEEAGGDVRGRAAAAIRIWSPRYPEPDRLPLDLRVDHDPDPLARMADLLSLHRALDG